MFFTVRLRTVIAVCLIAAAAVTTVVFAVSETAVRTDGIKVPILMYHSILKDPARSGKFVITPAELEDDLKYLKRCGYTAVFIRDLSDYVESGTPLPDKPVVISFDDGYYNNYLYAVPLMKQYEMKMVLSPVGAYTDRYTEMKDENAYYAHVTWDEISEMSKSGLVEIQNHSYNMHTISQKRNGTKKQRGESDEHYKTALTEDIGKMQELIKTHTGSAPIAFTYPFGSVSKASFDILKEMGFKSTLSCESGMNYITRDSECLYMMKRYIRPHGRNLSKILPD